MTDKIEFNMSGLTQVQQAVGGLNLFWQTVQLTENPWELREAMEQALKAIKELHGRT